LEHFNHLLLLTHQQVPEGVHLYLVVPEVERFDETCGPSVS
jgi:hypothetical protein